MVRSGILPPGKNAAPAGPTGAPGPRATPRDSGGAAGTPRRRAVHCGSDRIDGVRRASAGRRRQRNARRVEGSSLVRGSAKGRCTKSHRRMDAAAPRPWRARDDQRGPDGVGSVGVSTGLARMPALSTGRGLPGSCPRESGVLSHSKKTTTTGAPAMGGSLLHRRRRKVAAAEGIGRPDSERIVAASDCRADRPPVRDRESRRGGHGGGVGSGDQAPGGSSLHHPPADSCPSGETVGFGSGRHRTFEALGRPRQSRCAHLVSSE